MAVAKALNKLDENFAKMQKQPLAQVVTAGLMVQINPTLCLGLNKWKWWLKEITKYQWMWIW